MVYSTYRRSVLAFVCLCSSIAFFDCQQIFATAESEIVRFDVPEGKAKKTLKQAAQRAGLEIFFSASNFRGVFTHSVQGEFAPIEASNLMLAGASLAVFQHEKSGVYTIREVEIAEDANGGMQTQNEQTQSLEQTDMKIEKNKWLKTLAVALTLGIAGAESQLFGQDSSDEVFELSPFSVDASGDQGYYATETLSGTQLRTDMRSLANPVTVLTEEMMRDIGAVNYEEAVEYLPSTVAFAGDDRDFDGNTARTGTPYVSRGFRVTTLTQDFLSTGIRQDSFNTERLTQSRGPNSLLFGLGSVGGAINSGSKRARFNRDSKEFELRFDEHGSTRYVVDLNKILIEDKLGLRLAMLYDDKRTHRDLQYRRRKSIYANLTYKPYNKTTIHLNGEWGRIDDLNPRQYLPKDRYTAWANYPRPSIEKANMTDRDVITSRDNGAINEALFTEQGVSDRINDRSRFVKIINDPNLPVMNFAQKTQGGWPFVNGNRQTAGSITEPQLTPDVFYPITTVPSGPQDRYDTDYDKFSVTLEQQLFENTFLQVMYANENEANDDFRPVKRQEYTINVDNNWYLPTQRAADNPDPSTPMNPYFGLPYIESSAFYLQNSTKIEQKRATLSHKQSFGDVGWLGKLSLMGTYYTNDNPRHLLRQDEVAGVPILGNGTFDGNFGRSRINRRWYLTPDDVPYYPSDPVEPLVQSYDPSSGFARFDVPGNYIVPEVDSFFANRLSPIQDYEDTESTYVLGQWRLLNDLIMITYGRREDEITSDSARYERDPAFSNRYYTDLTAFAFQGESTAKVSNANKGIVVKPHHMFDFYYNESTNTVSAGSTAFTIFNETVPNQAGEGWDAGFRTFLLEDKLVLKLNYFENDLVNAISNPLRDGAAVGIGLAREGGRVERYLRGLEANAAEFPELNQVLDGAIFWEEYTGNRLWSDFENTSTSGYEMEAVFNPISNVRMMLNVTKNDTAVKETFVIFQDWYARFVDPVKGNTAITSQVAREGEFEDETIGDIIADFDRKRQFHEAQVGGQQVRSQTWKANFVTSYRFDNDSRMKGWRVGATARWREKPVIGYAEVDGQFRVDMPLYGYESFVTDTFVTKAWEGKNDNQWEASLRIRNLLNDDGWYPQTAVDDGTGNPYFLRQIFLEPRTFELTLRLRM